MLKKVLLTSLIASAMSFGLTACGDYEDSYNNNTGTPTETPTTGTPTTGTPTDKIVFSTFEEETDATSDKHIGIERYKTIISDGQLQRIITPVIGELNEEHNDDGDDYEVIAPNFYATTSLNKDAKTLDVSDNQFTSTLTDKYNKTLTATYEITYVDFKDISEEQIERDEAWYSKLKASNFPEGSACMVYSKSYPSFSYFTFDKNETFAKNEIGSDNTLQEWINSIKSSYGNQDLVETVVNVGHENNYKAVYFERNGQLDDDFTAVEYDGELYSADYYSELGEIENTDPTKGDVDCESINEIAADYLEEYIQTNVTVEDLNKN